MALKISLANIFVSLKSRNYRLYFAGQSISLIGTWMQNIAMSWLVYRLTGSAFLLGTVAFFSQFPTFLLAPFAGVLTDRYNKHHIMIVAQVFFMLHASVLAILTLFNIIEVWHIVLLSVVFGFISAFDAPARQSLVSDLIDKPKNLGNAIALNSAIFNGARLIGPAIAGIVIAIVGEGICFLINAVSYVAVIWALFELRIKVKSKPPAKIRIKESLTEGFKYTFGFFPIKTLLILLGILSLFGLPYTVLMAPYAKEILNGGSDTLGFLMSAAGAGALSAALFLAARKSVIGLGKIISISALCFGAGIIIVSFSNIFIISLFTLYLAGFGMIASISSINTLIQTLSEEDKRGRVMSFYAMALMGMNPIGNLVAGAGASFAGVAKTLFVGGIVTILAGAWFERKRPHIRKYTRPIYIKKGIIKEVAEGIQTATTLSKKI